MLSSMFSSRCVSDDSCNNCTENCMASVMVNLGVQNGISLELLGHSMCILSCSSLSDVVHFDQQRPISFDDTLTVAIIPLFGYYIS